MKIIELLQKSKDAYVELVNNKKYSGMCWCIKCVSRTDDNTAFVPYKEIERQIPEFNPVYLKSTKLEEFEKNKALQVGLEFWWDIFDSDSRIKAFDKLIELYERSDKEFVW